MPPPQDNLKMESPDGHDGGIFFGAPGTAVRSVMPDPSESPAPEGAKPAEELLPELYGLGRFQALQPAEQPAFLPALQPAAHSCGRIDCNHDRRRVASALQSAGGRSVALPVGKVGISAAL